MRTFKIFLASSSELATLREEFDLFIRRKNDYLHKTGIDLQVVLWENFVDAMSATRLQNEYNKAIESCDFFVCVFRSKAGLFTTEEFTYAWQHFKQHQRPLIYTYFQEAVPDVDKSLTEFKDRLKELGHYVTMFSGVKDLLLHFSEQLNKVLPNEKFEENNSRDSRIITMIGEKNIHIGEISGTANFNF